MSDQNFKFDDWRVTPTKNLLKNDEKVVHVEPKVMQLLICIASAGGEVVSRDELMERVWPRVVVADVLNNTVANLRKALGDTHSPRRYIETIPKQGYRLIPKVSWEAGAMSEADSGQQKAGSDTTKLRNDPVTKVSFFRAHKLSLFILMTLVIVVGAYSQFGKEAATVSEMEKSGTKKTLAVLPFDVFSDQSDIQHFAGGLVDELIHQLAANPDFRVIARTSSESFRNTNTDVKEISRVLGARYILEGSIRQSDDEIRVIVQLIDAQDGFHLWSRTFEHKKDDNILDTQIIIGERVTALISEDETGAKVYPYRKHPKSAEAYRLFLIAQSHLKFIEVSHLEKALEYFQRSKELAPDYALAYTGIAAAHLLLYQYKHNSFAETIRLSNEALDKAFSIEPNLAEAFAVRGLQETYLLQFDAADAAFKRAINLNPGLRFARHNYGFMLWSSFRPTEALEQFQIALEMDPLSTITNFAVGDVLGNLGEFDQAITHFLQCQELLPEDFSCFLGLANVYKLLGDFEQFSYYLNLAGQRVEADNFWLITTKGWGALAEDKLAESKALLATAFDKSPGNTALLELSLLTNLRSSSLDAYAQQLRQLIIETPNNLDLILSMGRLAYFSSDCNQAVAQYEQALKNNSNALLGLWGFAQGRSDLLNFAYCYAEIDQPDKAQGLLQTFHQYIQDLPSTTHVVPGRVYSEARYWMLAGMPDEARTLLQTIQDWPFIWLYDHEPIWKDGS